MNEIPIVSKFESKNRVSEAVALKAGLASDYYFNGKLEKALVEVDTALLLMPRYPRANFVKAIILVGMGKPEMAMRYAKRGIEIAPNNGIAYSILGECYGAFGNISNAKKNFQKGIDISSDNFLVYYNYACFLAENNELELSADNLKLAYPLDPDGVLSLISTDRDLKAFRRTDWFDTFFNELKNISVNG